MHEYLSRENTSLLDNFCNFRGLFIKAISLMTEGTGNEKLGVLMAPNPFSIKSALPKFISTIALLALHRLSG